jgi:hypothetical protein
MEKQRLDRRTELPSPRHLLRRLLGRTAGSAGTAPPAPSSSAEARLGALETQLNYLETVLEGLQDAVHRRARLEDRRNEELKRGIALAPDPDGEARGGGR